MERVGKAYFDSDAEVAARPCLKRAKQLEALVKAGDSGAFGGTFPADPVVVRDCRVCLGGGMGSCVGVWRRRRGMGMSWHGGCWRAALPKLQACWLVGTSHRHVQHIATDRTPCCTACLPACRRCSA